VALIRDMTEDDLSALKATRGGAAWRSGDHPVWRRYLDEQRNGVREPMVAMVGDALVGYVSLLWRSHYPPFADAGIPEISDLVVAEAHRRQGLAERMIGECEARARAEGHAVLGIGFGVYADYGAAQRLYVRLGYVPDGRGMTYDETPVTPGATYPVDDNMVLWLTKRIR
jgi:GNAT superfamily N-acetyltransferase